MAAFLKDVANMEFDGAFCNIECPSYLSVRHTPYDEREYLSFPCRKAESGNIFLKALSLQFLGACYRSIELLIALFFMLYQKLYAYVASSNSSELATEA